MGLGLSILAPIVNVAIPRENIRFILIKLGNLLWVWGLLHFSKLILCRTGDQSSRSKAYAGQHINRNGSVFNEGIQPNPQSLVSLLPFTSHNGTRGRVLTLRTTRTFGRLFERFQSRHETLVEFYKF